MGQFNWKGNIDGSGGGLTAPVDAADVGDGSVTNDLYNDLPGVASTGLLSGGVLSINGGDASKFDVSAGVGVVVERGSDESNPIYTKVSFGPFTAQTLPSIATQNSTVVYIDKTGSIQLRTSAQRYDPVEYRDQFLIGELSHINRTTINDPVNNACPARGFGESITDLSLAIGPINVSGNVVSPNGANLKINKSAGELFTPGGNYKNNIKAPSQIVTGALTPIPGMAFFYRDGSGGFNVALGTDIVPGSYDDGTGTLASVPVNKFTIQYIYISGGLVIVHYGQFVYNSISDAELAAQREDITHAPELRGIPLRCRLIVRNSTTDLTVVTDAEFITAGKFDGGGGSSGAGVSQTFQGTYDLSTKPQIIFNSTKNGLEFRDAATPVTSPLLRIADNSGNSFLDVTKDKLESTKQMAAVRVNAGNSGTSKTIDFNSSNVQTVTMTGNVTFTFSNPVDGGTYVLILVQDATGTRLATWPAAVKWAGGTAPTLSTGNGDIDVLCFLYDGTNYYGNFQGDFT